MPTAATRETSEQARFGWSSRSSRGLPLDKHIFKKRPICDPRRTRRCRPSSLNGFRGSTRTTRRQACTTTQTPGVGDIVRASQAHALAERAAGAVHRHRPPPQAPRMCRQRRRDPRAVQGGQQVHGRQLQGVRGGAVQGRRGPVSLRERTNGLMDPDASTPPL
eukprot:scaffold58_cov115-Isochrysis_galbana.AAC.4